MLNASYHLFLKSGLSAVSMQQIADDAGITKATLYHHFRDKLDLYLATMRLAIIKNENALQHQLDGAASLNDLVKELISYIFGDERADLQRLATDFRLHVESDTQTQFWKDFQLPWKLVKTAIENVGNYSEDEATHMARYVYGAASGLSQLYSFEQESYPITDALLCRLTESILYGISPLQEPK